MKNMYFWSPSVNFRIKNGNLRIERFNYGKKGAEFFPELYYYTQDGIELSDLKALFPENKSAFLNNFIKDLVKKKILVNSILSPKELFYSQKKLFNDDHDEDLRFVKKSLKNLKSCKRKDMSLQAMFPIYLLIRNFQHRWNNDIL